MTKKEEFMKIESYEEFDRRREEFENLCFDQEVILHMNKIFPKFTTTQDPMHESFPLTKNKNETIDRKGD